MGYLFRSSLVFLLFLLAGPSPLLFGSQKPELDFAVIKIRHRPAGELLEATRELLAGEGRVSLDRISNSLIVSAPSGKISDLRALLSRLDVTVPMITVYLRSRFPREAGRTLSTVTGITGTRPGLTMASGQFHQDTTLQATLNSGATTYLLISRDRPRTDYWLELCGRYGYRFSWLQTSQRLDTGFLVQATALPGKRIELALEPRLDFDNGHQVRLTRAATRITVLEGQWTPVAAADTGRDEINRAVISRHEGKGLQGLILEVKAQTVPIHRNTP